MGKSEDLIIESAIGVISRYGYRKTTMADIAEAAGVSRQTLYNKYPNKEEVLKASIRFGNETGLAQLRAAWAGDKTIAQKLDAFFEIGPLTWYDMVMSSPDSADLIEGANQVASDEMCMATRTWTGEFETLFESFKAPLAKHGQTPASFADFVYNSSASAKYNASSRQHLVERLGTIKTVVLATLDLS